MKRLTLKTIVLLIAIGFVANSIAMGQTTGSIDAIKRLVQKIDEDIAKMEESPEYSSVFRTELAVNKGNGSYPAVGIYRPVVKFYYTYGDREKDPYPNRLLKIVVTIDRSDRKEQTEFTFNDVGQLIFYFEKQDEIERRLYFANERPVRFEQGTKVLSLRAKSQIEIVATVRKNKATLLAIWQRSLGF
jgi:hypothetical protein